MTGSYSGVTSVALDEHTVEFGPGFPPDAGARESWHAIARTFYLDRFGGRPVWLAADWERTRAWPDEEDFTDESVFEVDGLELRTAHVALVDESFVERLLRSAGFQWDGILTIDHAGSYDELTVFVRQWFDSIGTSNHCCGVRAMPFIPSPTVSVFGTRTCLGPSEVSNHPV